MTDGRDFVLAMRRAFKGIHGQSRRRREAELAHGLAVRRSDQDRRARMRQLDDATPLRPGRGDLVTGPAAQRELARLERKNKDSL